MNIIANMNNEMYCVLVYCIALLIAFFISFYAEELKWKLMFRDSIKDDNFRDLDAFEIVYLLYD